MNVNELGLAEELKLLSDAIWKGDVNGIVSCSARLAQRAALAQEPGLQQMAMLAGQASHQAFSILWKSQDNPWKYATDASIYALASLRSMENPFHARWIDSALVLMAEDACSTTKVMKITEEARRHRCGAPIPTEWPPKMIDKVVRRETQAALAIHCLGSAGASYGPEVEGALGGMVLALAPYKKDEEPWREFFQKIWREEFGPNTELVGEDALLELIEGSKKPNPSTAPRRRG